MRGVRALRLDRGLVERGTLLMLLGAVVLAPVVLTRGGVLHAVRTPGEIGLDFVPSVFEPARAVLHGTSPYPPGQVDPLYPPAIFVVAAPIGLLSKTAAIAVWFTLLLGASLATLRLLGTRDWRCYGVWLTSAPVVWGLLLGNATLVVVLLLAVGWRWRASSRALAGAFSASVVIKLFAVPLGAWLLLSRRLRAAAISAVSVPLALLVAWAIIGFDSLGRYPSILSRGDRVRAPHGVLVQALAQRHGSTPAVALAIAALPAVACLGLGVLRRRDELACFTLVLAAALLLTPICWIYYLGLLVVPLARRCPRLSAEWGIFAGLWILAFSPAGVIVVATLLVWRLARPPKTAEVGEPARLRWKLGEAHAP